MRKIKLTKMSIHNFKGVGEMGIDFGEKTTTVKGCNGSGKTTIFDAFTWVLFGKNHNDETDKGRGSFSVKRIVDGKPVMHEDHEVTIFIEIDGIPMTLGRRLTETWRTRGGEQRFDGDKTTCLWDGIEMGVNEYTKRIESEIISPTTFKMLTNPNYFSNMPWKEQMAILVKAFASDITLEEVAKRNNDWQAEITKLPPTVTIKDVKTQISTEKARLQSRLSEIPNIIKGIREATPEAEDFAELRSKRSNLNELREQYRKSIEDKNEAERAVKNEINDIKNEILEHEEKRRSHLASVNAERRHEVEAANEEYNGVRREISLAETKKASLTKERDDRKAIFESAEASHRKALETIDKDIASLLEEWNKVDAETFPSTENLICPLCKEPCDSATMKVKYHNDQVNARAKFNEGKSKRLDDIDAKGAELEGRKQKELAEWDALKKQQEKELADNWNKSNEAFDNLRTLKEKFATMHPKEFVAITEDDYTKECDKRIAELNGKIAEIEKGGTDESVMLQEYNQLNDSISEIDKRLHNETIIIANEEKIKKFEDEADSLAKQKDCLERRYKVIQDLEHSFTDELEGVINRAFSRVKFCTKVNLINGEVEDTCYPTLDGTRYQDLNDAGKIFAGLDIISTLKRIYDIEVPIFIDRAESVTTQVYPYEGQMVRLVATYDAFEVVAE